MLGPCCTRWLQTPDVRSGLLLELEAAGIGERWLAACWGNSPITKVIGAESQIPTYEPATNILEELGESFLAIVWPLSP